MRDPTAPLAARVAGVASRQHGTIARRQLLELEMSSATIARWVKSGHLHRIHRGVYAVGHTKLSQEARWMAATLACGDGSALSHAPAGQLQYFIDRKEHHGLHISLPSRFHAAVAGVTTHRPRRLEPVDIKIRQGIPVTTPTRTVWDLASIWPPERARRIFERVDGRGNLDRSRMRKLHARSPSRRGAGLIAELLGNPPLPLHLVRSWLEELLFHVCSEHGLPLPEPSTDLLGYEVDFLWTDAKFIVEADGGHHYEDSQRDSDNDRDFVHGRAGFLTRRYSYKAMGRERLVAEEVRSTLVDRLR